MSWRGWLLAMAGGLLAGLLTLLWRADGAIMRERELRHAARATEVFARMELHLSRLLEREEGRPVEHYQYFYVPEGLVAGSVALSVSPLAVFPPPSPIRAYLRIESNGGLHSPHRPDETSLAAGHGWQADPAIEQLLGDLRVQLPPSPAEGAQAETATSSDDQLLADFTSQAKEAGAQGLQISQAEVQQSFGSRKARQQEDRELQAQSVYNMLSPDNRINQQLRNQFTETDPGLAQEWVEDEVAQALSPDPQSLLRARVDPMKASRLPGGDLLLLRRVQVQGQAHRQGFVLDRAALERELAGDLLKDSELASWVQLRWQGAVEGVYVFRYRFEEPFEDLELALGMDALPALIGTERRWLWSLGGGLALVGLAGAVAIERMVGLRLAFARRRQQFVAAVSHELKTPLTAIRMYAEMLGEGMVRDEQQRQEYYGTIRAESERLSRMIGNVLELGKLERGAVDVNLQCGALRPVLEEMRALLAPHIAAQGFRLEIDCPEDLPPALFDRELLLQVLVNVCDNSLKFAAEAADKRICIDARQVQEGVRLSLRDFGPGVAPAHLPRIFDSFYRGEDELTRRHKGSGIGLALVRGLVERMRGRVAAANHPQGGFQLSLVLAVA